MNADNLQTPILMGILNLTEDSFSDGSLYLDGVKACLHAENLVAEGARIIDLGAESTRPGALPVSAKQQLSRLLPVLMTLKSKDPAILYSIDTQDSLVAAETISKGANLINDVSALRHDPKMAEVLASQPQVKIILMHMQGSPQTMQQNPVYQDLLAEVREFLEERIAFCLAEGILAQNIILDPGIGFGKNLEHNLALLANLHYFKSLGYPLLLGASRKSFIDLLCPAQPRDRLEGTLAAAVFAMLDQVDYLRVHDVQAHRRFIAVLQAIRQYRKV